MNAPEDALAILAGHGYMPSLTRGVSRCTCGIPFHGMPHEHRAHVAQVLAEWVVGEKAQAWDEGYDSWPAAARINPYRKDQEAGRG